MKIPVEMPVARRRPPVRKVSLRPQKAAVWSDTPVTIGFVIICLVVHVAWLLALRQGTGVHFLEANFILTWDSLLTGHVWTLFSAAVSHNEVSSFLIGAYVIYSFGTQIEKHVGSPRLALVMASCILAGSASYLALSAATGVDVGLHGAWAVTLGLGGVYAVLWPSKRIMLFFIFPVPAAAAIPILAALDLYGLFSSNTTAAHLGGLAVGLVFGAFWRLPGRPKKSVPRASSEDSWRNPFASPSE